MAIVARSALVQFPSVRWVIAVAGLCGGLACGPSISVDGDADTTAASDGTAQSSADGGASMSETGADVTTAVPGTTADPDTGTSADSTGAAPMFSDEDVLGGWSCEGEGPSFYMQVDAFMSPYDIGGIVCTGWDGGPDPAGWEPCGDLTVHPVGGGGPMLWIYALLAGMPDTISAMLVYDPATDAFTGIWSGPGIDNEGAAVTCKRVV